MAPPPPKAVALFGLAISAGGPTARRVFRGLRVFREKTIGIGNTAPGSRYAVREPHSPVPDDPSPIGFQFKIHGSDEYHIPEQ